MFIFCTNRYNLHKFAAGTLNNSNYQILIEVPEENSLNDWLAVNTVEFYNRLNLFYGALRSNCTNESCPIMKGGPNIEYYWKRKKKTIPPDYIENVMVLIEKILDNPKVFPPDESVKFPKNFKRVTKEIFTKLYRIFAHIYVCHFQDIENIGAVSHLNTTYKHFYFFSRKFKLIKKREYEPLKFLNIKFEIQEEKKEKERQKQLQENNSQNKNN
ncbi:mob kinase activator-like 1 [Anaeramoeba flamelloides]|uniref:Mob kinase activator-like 1 n=1 Tax=Anaeramoeba flamelloides TaxID=1746091 RepID=A0ABQ8XWS6_9EUKA|nr:mob kinase activator-like 1 [Anaeramoeba flamelloides]